jgi:hypothetical protein
MFKHIGIAVLSLLFIAQSVPLAVRATEDPAPTTTLESAPTPTTTPTTNNPASSTITPTIPTSPTTSTTTTSPSTTPTLVSTTPETHITTSTDQNTKNDSETEGSSEEDDDEVIDTSNESDLDLHKNLEGIVRQSEPYTCGPAALATLLSQLGDDTTEHDVLSFAPASKDTGVSLFSLKRDSYQSFI